MTAWRTSLRLAYREARRAKGRAALVVGLILLPVAAMSFLAVAYDSFTLTPGETADRQMGTAQAAITWGFDDPVAQVPDVLQSYPLGKQTLRPKAAEPSDEQLLSLLPQGSRVIRDRESTLTMHTAAGTGSVRTRLLDYTDPLARGMIRQVTGRAPASDGEVALTAGAAGRLGAGVGGTVRLADGSRTFQVVGTVEEPDNLDAMTIYLRPQPLPGADPGGLTWLADTPGPLTWDQVKELNTHGAVALSRYVLAHPPSEAEKYQLPVHFGGSAIEPGLLTVVAGLAILEIVLLAGPAFAVGARRRQRELALVAATGGTPRQVRRIVLADGVVLGSVAAVTGAALGIAAAAVGRPLIEDLLTKRFGAFRTYPVAQLVLIGLAVLTGVLAALVPAWISARQDVVAALAGRRGIIRSRRRWPIIGLALAGTGGASGVIAAVVQSMTLLLAGLVLLELGLALLTPALVGLVARIGRLLPLAPRIALRDASRNRAAAAPAISAVMAAVVTTMAIAMVILAVYRQGQDAFTGRQGDVTVSSVGGDGQLGNMGTDVESSIRGVMPVESVHLVNLPSCGGVDCLLHPRIPPGQDCPYWYVQLGHPPSADEQRAARNDPRCDRADNQYAYFGMIGAPFGLTVVIEPDAAGAVANIPAQDAAVAAEQLRKGLVVVDDPRFLDNGRVTLGLEKLGTDPLNSPTVTAPGFALPHQAKAPILMMTSQTAESLGLGVHPIVTLATTTRMPTTAEQDRLQAVLGSGYAVEVARATDAVNGQLLVLAIVAGIIALGAAGLATGLAAAESRADLGTLAAVGASPRLRRTLSLSQTGVIAGLGSLLGTIAGVGAASLLLFALNQGQAGVWPGAEYYPITVPWLNVIVALVVVPGVAMLGAGLLTRSRLPIERRL